MITRRDKVLAVIALTGLRRTERYPREGQLRSLSVDFQRPPADIHGLHHRKNLNPNRLHAVVDGVAFDGFEAGAVDHFDDLLFGHFYVAAGFDGVAVGEFAAVGDGAVEVVGAEVVAIKSPS